MVGHTQGNNLSDFIPDGYTEYSRDSQDLNNDGQDDCFLIIKKVDRNRHGVLALFKNDKNYERIIPNVLTETLKTGWFFKILGGGTIRTNLADQLAVRLGAKQGVIVIATPAQKFLRDGVPPSEDIEAIISDVVSSTFQRSPVYSKFYDDNQHLYIFQVLKSKKRRKKFLMLIDQKPKYATLINQIKTAEARDGNYKTSTDPDIDKIGIIKIGTIPVMTSDQYRLWQSDIDKSIQNIESRSKQSDSNITPGMVDDIKKTYNSIKFLDLSKMKKSS